MQNLGPLSCIVVDGGPSPTIPVIILHGYGASASDLAPLAESWIDAMGRSAASFRFIFPDAIGTLAEMGMPEARAWWPINMAGMMAAIDAGQFSDLHDHEPPGLDAARLAVAQCIEAARPTPTSLYVLGGFSQGAMLAMDVALRSDVDAPAALIQMSGTLICQSPWSENLQRLRQTRIVQSHGTHDPVLPYTSAVTLRDLLTTGKLDVRFLPFEGPHTVGPDMVEVSAELLESLVPPSDA